MQTDHGLDLPRRLQIEFAPVIQKIADDTGKEITSEIIWKEFERQYLAPGRFDFVEHTTLPTAGGERHIEARLRVDGEERTVHGEGNGPMSAFVDAIRRACGIEVEILDYREHAVGRGAKTSAAAYVEATVDGKTVFGVGIDPNIVAASLRAVASAVNRATR
jgi:2-isopropylmalate synthase